MRNSHREFPTVIEALGCTVVLYNHLPTTETLTGWMEAYCRGHVQSASHSSNHLGEGLRHEPIVALAGRHLMRVSECTENMGRWRRLRQEKPISSVTECCSVDAVSPAWKRSRLAYECNV